MTRHFTLLTLLLLLCSLGAQAVTEKEMDRAKANVAKAYLRYANNGAGYLDEVTVNSISELEGKLKAKDLENLKAVKNVSIPKDYDQWTKEQFVEFWGTTFFQAPGLDPEGVKGRIRARKYVMDMSVTPPSKKEEPKPEEADNAQSPEIPSDLTTLTSTEPTPEQTAAEADSTLTQEEVLAEQETKSSGSSTWVYIMVLAILVVIVIWLVFYASSTMKKQNRANRERRTRDDDDDDDDEDDDLAPSTVSPASSARGAELERLRSDNENLRLRVASLQAEITALHSQMDRIAAERDAARAARMAEERPQKRAVPEETPAQFEKQAKYEPVTIFLGRVNNRGVFVRADRNFAPGHSIYRLVTSDGVSGTFYVADSPEALELALLNPQKTLMNACVGEDLENPDGVTGIENLSAGTAIFENGVWQVTRKARIRYRF